jgi:hypothetical protein
MNIPIPSIKPFSIYFSLQNTRHSVMNVPDLSNRIPGNNSTAVMFMENLPHIGLGLLYESRQPSAVSTQLQAFIFLLCPPGHGCY